MWVRINVVRISNVYAVIIYAVFIYIYMLNPSDLTVFKNIDGLPTALGFPIRSVLLQNNKALFMHSGGAGASAGGAGASAGGAGASAGGAGASAGGAGASAGGADPSKKTPFKQFENLAVPAGLICMNKMVCINANANANANANQTDEVISESLFDKLFALAETKAIVPKKISRRHTIISKQKNKTRKHK